MRERAHKSFGGAHDPTTQRPNMPSKRREPMPMRQWAHPAKAEPSGPSATVLADEYRLSGHLGSSDTGNEGRLLLCRARRLGSLGSSWTPAREVTTQSTGPIL